MFSQKEILEEFAELSYLGYNRIGQEEFLWRKREYDRIRMATLLENPSYRRTRNAKQRAVYPRYYLSRKLDPDFKAKRAAYSKMYFSTPAGKASNRAATKRYQAKNRDKFLAYQAAYRERKRAERNHTECSQRH